MLKLESQVSRYLMSAGASEDDVRDPHMSMDEVLADLHPHQRMAFETDAEYVCLCTGLGGGKTHMAARWIRERAKMFPTKKHLVTINSYGQSQDVILGQIEAALEEDKIPFKLQERTTRPTYTLELPRGKPQILVRSLHKPNETLRGVEAVSWWGDEIRDATEYACDVAYGRIRDPKGRPDSVPPSEWKKLWVTTPNGHDHIWKTFAKGVQPRRVAPSNGYPVNLYEQKNPKTGEIDTLLIQTDTRANVSVDEAYGDGLARRYDPKLLEQERSGKFIVVGERIYYAFSYEDNVSSAAILNHKRPWSICLDFGGAAHNSLIVVQERGGVTRICDEIYLRGGGTPAVIAEFLKRYSKTVRKNPPTVYGDAFGNWGSTTDIRGAYEMWRDAMPKGELGEPTTSFRIQKANPSEANRLASVNRRLLNGEGRRSMMVHPDCEHLIMDFEQAQPDEITGKQVKNKDTADLTHCADALGYYIYMRFPVIARRSHAEHESGTVL